MSRPTEIVETEIVDAIAQRYGRLPREIRAEDASLLRDFEIVMSAPRDEAD